MKQLKNRSQAGQLLAEKLQKFADDPNVIVLALPRGGVPVAFEIAQRLRAPLDIFLVRKLGVPDHEELAMGAISSSDDRVLNQEVIDALQISDSVLERVIERERQEIKRRESLYRQNRPPLRIQGKTVILVDDGLATGSTMLAAIRAVQKQKAAKIIIAVPVAPQSAFESMRKLGDDMLCVMTPEPFYSVGLWYEDFTQTPDDEVVHLLAQAANWTPVPAASSAIAQEIDHPGFQYVSIPVGAVELPAKLLIRDGESHQGIILLFHSIGYPGQSPQHDHIACRLYEEGFSTVRFDLLTEEEEASELQSRHLRFNIPLLTQRLIEATEWAKHELVHEDQPIGYFSSSTGTAAALKAAAVDDQIKAIVSLSGRPDLAGDALSKVSVPTLFLMGGQDVAIMDLNVCARSRMRPGLVRIEVVPYASHLFEEEGALDRAANLAIQWFDQHLADHDSHESVHYEQAMRSGNRGRTSEYGMFV